MRGSYYNIDLLDSYLEKDTSNIPEKDLISSKSDSAIERLGK